MAAGLLNLPIGRLVSPSLPSPRLHFPHQCAGVPPDPLPGPVLLGLRPLARLQGFLRATRMCGSAASLLPRPGLRTPRSLFCCAGRRADSGARRSRDAWAGVCAAGRGRLQASGRACKIRRCLWPVLGGVGGCARDGCGHAECCRIGGFPALSLCRCVERTSLCVRRVCVAHGVPAVAARRVGRFLKLCAWFAGVRSGLGPALGDVGKRGGEYACAPRLASLPVRLAARGRTCKPRACLLNVLGRPQQQRCCCACTGQRTVLVSRVCAQTSAGGVCHC